MRKSILLATLFGVLLTACQKPERLAKSSQPVYEDVAYLQDYAVKYYPEEEDLELKKVYSDRNEVVQILTSKGLMNPDNGHFQYPGKIRMDQRYILMGNKNISDLALYQNQFVYLDGEAIFSNAWAGKLFSRHGSSQPGLVVGGKDFSFLIASTNAYSLVKDSKTLAKAEVDGPILDGKYDSKSGAFYILTENSILQISEPEGASKAIFRGEGLTAFDFLDSGEIVVASREGFLFLDSSGKVTQDLNTTLPWTELTAVRAIDGKLWFGSTRGAFMLKEDGKFNYYYGERWLPGNQVVDIEAGPENSVLILTDKGLGQIKFEWMTLEEKALRYEKQVRHRHIRYGINSNLSRLTDHDLATAENGLADSDNLWTGMYMGSQLFRYLVTKSEEAKQNCIETFEAMERLHHITGVKGLFGRTFERSGHYEFRTEYRDYVEDFWYEGYNNNVSWNHSSDPEWDWRASASSDQTVGQIFALILMGEYMDDGEYRQRAITLLDDMMGYIVANNYTLVDVDGKPSLWGYWNPEHINRFQTMVGDRKIYSSNLIAFLQAAYKLTGKELYKEKALDLMQNHGYLENLARPFKEIGQAPADADNWSKMLSQEWNHSDDEMYFLAYWGLYPYALNDTLREVYREAIKDHWEFERPEKNALWNFCYAMTGAEDFDLEESVWHLKEFPLDMIEYKTENSHRKDIVHVPVNFWGQKTSEVLPPDERPELKHNKNLFTLDGPDRKSELSAGDTFLLPYWMGRYLGVISAPKTETE
ncbi:hypothetical protein J0A67_03060 [Algoriphagus aestuariicola]|uniref:Uncharacterized protein n=1 Tax=Algoriphagus aestuariicola TaxID=1852016 RepID=A0ABS3BL81_9BACT|nr:hypothetical protein [Algoriphagus aestuariicola]MBN7799820.1 hypothetical protein [Algoriphagus aestuariicola]